MQPGQPNRIHLTKRMHFAHAPAVRIFGDRTFGQANAGSINITPTIQDILARTGWNMLEGSHEQSLANCEVLKSRTDSDILHGEGFAIKLDSERKTYSLHTEGAFQPEAAKRISRQLLERIFGSDIAPALLDSVTAKEIIRQNVIVNPAEQLEAQEILYYIGEKVLVTRLEDLAGGRREVELLLKVHGFETLGIRLTEPQRAFYDICSSNHIERAITAAKSVARFEKEQTVTGENVLKFGELGCRDDQLIFFRQELNTAGVAQPPSATNFIAALARRFPELGSELLGTLVTRAI